MIRPVAGMLLLLLPVVGRTADPVGPPRTARGEQMIHGYFQKQVAAIEADCLRDIGTRADWERRRPQLRQQFFEMMGLWPLPPRTDLKPTITGKVETERFTIEKLHFQSMPGLYVTANLYIPKPAPTKAPAILYVCGHGNVVKNGVSFGSKVQYQHHPAWFAEHGYVCLILDTLQLGEIEGIHHGTYRFGMWWWQTVGYTPAGIECWNGMRALDYLQSRPEVDPARLGVTGRSGGGATSWWVAAADDRVQAIVPVAGIADLRAHLVEGVAERLRTGVIAGHCDCMYFINTYRWDFPYVLALCAPRPLLLGNSDVDDIFPVPGYRRMVDRVRKVYDLYGAGEKFQLLETAGPHKDTPELRRGAFAWMNRWLKNDQTPITETEYARQSPESLQVLERMPEDSINKIVHEVVPRPARVELPRSPEVARAWWQGKREEWLTGLRERVFRGWPTQPPPLNARKAVDQTDDGIRLRGYDFTSEDGIDLRVWLVTAARTEKPTLVVLNALDETGWAEWNREMGPAFAEAMQVLETPVRDTARFEQNRRVLGNLRWAFAFVAPRGIGPTRWATDGSKEDIHIRRRFALIGQTLDGQRVWDVRRALAALGSEADLAGVPRWLQGKNEMAGIALYAGIFEPDVARLDLWNLPTSHQQGPTFLHIRQLFDLPQALALAAPKKVRLYLKDQASQEKWAWITEFQKVVGTEFLQVRVVGE